MVPAQADRGDASLPTNLLAAGKITTVHGVKGWVKIHSFTAPEENIFEYQPWWMHFPDGWRKLDVDQFRTVDKGFIAHIVGVDDREQARLYCQREIQVSADAFPDPEEGAVYWHQLLGMKVLSRFGGQELLLGTVSGLLETGANDVLVVQPCPGAIDNRERLIPYVEQFVVDVQLDTSTVIVDWDPEFEACND